MTAKRDHGHRSMNPLKLLTHPTSPAPPPAIITTPVDPPGRRSVDSPRKVPIPPSPTFSTAGSNVSNNSGLAAAYEAPKRGSFDAIRRSFDMARPSSMKEEKKLPHLPGLHGLTHGLPFSFGQGHGHGQAGDIPKSPQSRRGTLDKQAGGEKGAGLYDGKLVTSTLSQTPHIPPVSPTPTANTSFSSGSRPANVSAAALIARPSFASLTGGHTGSQQSRPQFPPTASSAGIVVLPDGTALSTSTASGEIIENRFDPARSVKEALAISSPRSPWSLLTIHCLPIFTGSPLKSSIEDLNHLCHNHIMATSQRISPSRLVPSLLSDLQDFIASGMLTLKAKIEMTDDSKIVARTAEIWTFFWSHILSFLEGVFLPFSQMQDLPSSSTTSSTSTHPIPVRQLLLTGFLLHIILPLLPRLFPLLTTPQHALATISTETARSGASLSQPDLQKVLQLSLILATQTRYSYFANIETKEESLNKDREIRVDMENLSKAVRWRINNLSRPQSVIENTGIGTGNPKESESRRASLQRAISTSAAGLFKRRGWRASSNFGSSTTQPINTTIPVRDRSNENLGPSRQNSDFSQFDNRWGRPRIDDEDEEDNDTTPGQPSQFPSRANSFATQINSVNPSAPSAASTLTAGTWRNTGYEDDQRTPQADFGIRRV